MSVARKGMRRKSAAGYVLPVAAPRPPRSLLRTAFLGLVRLFYREIAVSGGERLPNPAEGPVVVVANHPNGLLDPVVIRLALGRPVAFLAKSTLFGNPLGRAAMGAFEAIPVYRAQEADTARNEETFQRCRQVLLASDGSVGPDDGAGWLALFPEGTSHSDSQLKALKTGAARIALSAEAADGFRGRVRILPLGLLYEDKGTFRSRVAVSVGESFTMSALEVDAAALAADERACVGRLTARIGAALSDCVLEAGDQQTWKALQAVAAWTSPGGGRDLAAVERRARQLAAAWRQLLIDDPEQAGALTERFRRYVRMVETFGITDPLAWEGETAPTPAGFLGSLAPLILLAPLALLGAVMGWAPYRAVRPLAVRLAGQHTDLISTFKLLLGLLTLTSTYVAWAIVGAWLMGPSGGLAALLLGPLSGFVSLRYGERVERRRELLRSLWLRATRARVAAGVAERRAELNREVETALSNQGIPEHPEKK